jgi:SAM-dependent methyltransferase
MGTSFKVLGKRLNQHQGKNPKSKTGITTSVVKCNDCGLIFANPIPVPQLITDHYNVEVDHYFEDGIKNTPEDYFQQELDFFNSIYKSNPSLKGLDIGAGLGGIMRALERNGIDAYGLEPSKNFYDFAVAKGVRSDRLFNKSIEDAAFSDEQFDLIIFSAVFEHLYDPNQALVNALKWLKPGGMVYIGVPTNRIFIQLLANLFYKLKGLDYVSNISPMHAPFHLYEFDLRSFKKNSALNNYTIKHVDFWTTQDYVFRKPNSVIRKIIKLAKADMNLTIWLRKNET